MDMCNVRHQVEGQEWQQRILEQRSSGMSVRKWCAEQNIRESQFYYWLHVLRSEELAVRKPAGIFAELPLKKPDAEERNCGMTGICAIIRGQGLCLEIYNGADSATLETAMRTLGVGRG